MGLNYYFSGWPYEGLLWRMGEVCNSVIGFSPQSGSSRSRLGLDVMVSITRHPWARARRKYAQGLAVGSKRVQGAAGQTGRC